MNIGKPLNQPTVLSFPTMIMYMIIVPQLGNGLDEFLHKMMLMHAGAHHPFIMLINSALHGPIRSYLSILPTLGFYQIVKIIGDRCNVDGRTRTNHMECCNCVCTSRCRCFLYFTMVSEHYYSKQSCCTFRNICFVS